MASITSKKKGKYLKKESSSDLTQIYLETLDSQVLLATALTVGGTTYAVDTPLSTVLADLNTIGKQYRLQAGSTANIIKLQSSTNGGSTWSDVTSITVNNVANATAATNVALSATGTGTNSITIQAGSGTAASFTVNNVAAATKATQDGSGNVITSTYATKTELANVEAGVTRAYVTTTTSLTGSDFEDLIQTKTASQKTEVIDNINPNADYSSLDFPSKASDFNVGDTIYIKDADVCDWFIASIKPGTNANTIQISFASIEADTPVLDGYVTGSDLYANTIVLGNGNSAIKKSTCTIATTMTSISQSLIDNYVPTLAKVYNVISNSIGNLDVSNISGFGTGKTLATLTETDGKIAATFQDISITKSQISDFPTIPTISGTAPISASTSGGTTTITHNTSGVTASTYSAVTVNTYGHVTAGAQIIKYVSSVDADVSNVANGGTVIVVDSN